MFFEIDYFFRCVNLTSVSRVSSPSVLLRRYQCVVIVPVCLFFNSLRGS